MRRNVASQFVGCQLVSKTDGSAVTSGTTTVYVTGDAGTQAAGSVGSGACTHEGNGFWTYAPAQAETNYTHVAFTFVNSSACNATVQIYPTSYDASGRYDVGLFGGTAGTFASGRPEVNTSHIAGSAVSTSSAQIGVNVVNAGGTAWGSGAITAASIAADAITDAKVAADVTIASVTGAVGSVTGNVGGNVTGSVGSLATQAKADVNAEVVDALNVDTYAEPGQGNPSATATLVQKIGYLYKAWRNKVTQDATTYKLYADDASTVDQKATVSDDGSTLTKGEIATGP